MLRAATSYRGRHDTCTDLLADAIVAGTLMPGDVLDLGALERVHGFSRGTVRESVRTLQAKGLLSVRPYHGTIVRPRERWHLLDPDVMRWCATSDRGPMYASDRADLLELLHRALEGRGGPPTNMYVSSLLRLLSEAPDRADDAAAVPALSAAGHTANGAAR